MRGRGRVHLYGSYWMLLPVRTRELFRTGAPNGGQMSHVRSCLRQDKPESGHTDLRVSVMLLWVHPLFDTCLGHLSHMVRPWK